MRRTLPLAATAVLASVAAATTALAPAHGVKHGEDADGYSMVGLMVAHDGEGNALWDCSGTLVSPTAFVTGGHCTSADTVDDEGRPQSVARVELWFGDGRYEANEDFLADVASPGDPSCIVDGSPTDARHAGYPCTGEATGTAHTHPDYDPGRFWLHDLGVVVLSTERPADATYARLPGPGDFDAWKSNRKETFDAVGYGKQDDFGQGAVKDQGAVERRVAHPELRSINTKSLGDHAMELSGNANTGGTCSGDSGGPNFLAGTLVIAGVTSYGKNGQTCSGSDGAYRLDRADDITFLSRFGLR